LAPSPEGSRFVETLMTVVAILKQQHRNVLAYVTVACETALPGDPAPSLLPTADDLKRLMHLAA
jgi:transposase